LFNALALMTKALALMTIVEKIVEKMQIKSKYFQ